MVENLGLSFRNTRELNRIINEELPGRPKFKREEVHIGRESYDFHFREIIPSLRALFGDPKFSDHLIFAPERHYQDASHTVQVFSEMYTGKWWWSVQVCMKASYICFRSLMLLSAIPGGTQTRRNYIASHHFVRQDPTHAFPSQECLSNLLNYWQHSQGHSQQANSTRATAHGLHSDHSAQAYQKQGGAAPCACKSLPLVYAQSPLTH